MKWICGPHARRIPAEIHPAFALAYSPDGRHFTPLCQKSLNNWLDNADDDPSLEPSSILWLTSRQVTG